MSKHTCGPWAVFNQSDVFTNRDDGKVSEYIADCAVEELELGEIQANARLIAAAPELLAIVTRELRNGEQSHFEDWLERTCPSGDVEAVERQWAGSADYAVFVDEYREELAVLDKIEGRS